MFEVIGHRGAGILLDENTIESFQKAHELGCPRVELDVHITSDGAAVLIHDPFLDKTTDGSGNVEDYTLAEIKQFKTSGGYTVPELSELFSLFESADLAFQIELKGEGSELAVPGIVKRFRLEDRVRYTSFVHSRVKTALDGTSGSQGGLLMCALPIDPVGMLKEAGARNIHLPRRLISTEIVEKMHNNNCKVVAWENIIEERDFLDLLSMGVDGATTDRPDLFLEVLQRYQTGSLNRKK